MFKFLNYNQFFFSNQNVFSKNRTIKNKKCFIVFLCFIFCSSFVFSQENVINNSKEIDTLYKEDQFYFGFTYNLIGKKPSTLSQSGFSGGFHLGFIKDMPINKKRNKAIGLGFGLALNSFNQNILISENNNGLTQFEIIDETNITFSKNKFTNYIVEMPLEFRWRTSTATSYKFWRIYTGFKLAYVIANRTNFKGTPQNIKLNNIKAFNNLQYSVTLAAGYNTWNFYLDYALHPIFNDTAKINGNVIDANAIKIGLMFYIL